KEVCVLRPAHRSLTIRKLSLARLELALCQCLLLGLTVIGSGGHGALGHSFHRMLQSGLESSLHCLLNCFVQLLSYGFSVESLFDLRLDSSSALAFALEERLDDWLHCCAHRFSVSRLNRSGHSGHHCVNERRGQRCRHCFSHLLS